ncbi:MAG: lipopolysaccharide heptosyltransferase II [Candidatus Omnitrophica bacterium]|nr:lipopolysaccharide heptosyltransferase II [Candidatus Omnitrophota bacterium]
MQQIQRIVIFRTDRIGEVILTTPLIKALKEKYPAAHITFFTSKLAEEILQFVPRIDSIHTFDTLSKPNFFDFLKLILQLRKGNFDLTLISNPHKYIHLAAFLSGIKNRIGFSRKWGKWLLTHSIKDVRSEGKIHEIQANLQLLNILDIKQDLIKPEISVPEIFKEDFKQQICELNLDPTKPIISIHPGSSYIYKRWPKEYFIDLIHQLLKSYSAQICINGDASEKKLCEDIASHFSSNVVSLAGKFTLKDLTIFLSLSNLVITNDSGPMHIADALNKNLIAIFGRGNEGTGPNRWGPKGPNSYILHKVPGQCKKCQDQDCLYDYECLKMTKPQEVLDLIAKNQLLGKSKED